MELRRAAAGTDLEQPSWARVRWQVFDRDGWLLFPLPLDDQVFVCFLRFVRLAL